MSKKNKDVTIGELLDLLLSRNFSKEDIVVVENSQGNEKSIEDIGVSVVNGKERKLIISLVKRK